jgi:hypothetical protein
MRNVHRDAFRTPLGRRAGLWMAVKPEKNGVLECSLSAKARA